jgi:hypothetical protein
MDAHETMTNRWIRVVLGVLLALTVLFKIAVGGLAIVALIAACIALITGVAGFCAIYSMFGSQVCRATERR